MPYLSDTSLNVDRICVLVRAEQFTPRQIAFLRNLKNREDLVQLWKDTKRKLPVSDLPQAKKVLITYGFPQTLLD